MLHNTTGEYICGRHTAVWELQRCHDLEGKLAMVTKLSIRILQHIGPAFGPFGSPRIVFVLRLAHSRSIAPHSRALSARLQRVLMSFPGACAERITTQMPVPVQAWNQGHAHRHQLALSSGIATAAVNGLPFVALAPPSRVICSRSIPLGHMCSHDVVHMDGVQRQPYSLALQHGWRR